jgi:tetratricopeptide (TPR) repeat protein
VANAVEDNEDIGATTFDDVPANAEASRVVRGEANPSWAHGKAGESLKELQRKLQERREHPERRFALVPYAVGAAIVLVLVIVLVAKCGGDDHAKPSAKTQPAPPSVAPSPTPPTQPPAPGSAAVADDLPAEPDEIEMLPDDNRDERRKRRPKPKQSAETLYAEGLDHMRKNEHRAALASFTEARRANPSFAPAWYGIGLVHEKLGKKGAAKAAYLRYLSLAPKASNAAQVRERLERL